MTVLRTASGSLVRPLSADQVSRVSQPSRLGKAGRLLHTRVVNAAARVAIPGSVNKAAYDSMVDTYPLNAAPQGPPSDPFLIPNVYDDPAGNTAAIVPFRYDGIRAQNFALRYAMTGDEAAAAAAVAQLSPWSTMSGWSAPAGSDTRLSWSYTWPLYLGAAQLLRGSAAYTTALDNALKDVTTRSRPICSTAFTSESNHGDWGVVFEFAAAAFLDEPAKFAAAADRWRFLLDKRVDANNALTLEIYRQGSGQGNGSHGLLYSDFSLQAKVYAAEIARANGLYLYDYVSPQGRSVRPIWELIAGWMANPATFPYNSSGSAPVTNVVASGHYEILHALWPTAGSAAVLAERRPVQDRYGAMYLSVTHAGIPLQG